MMMFGPPLHGARCRSAACSSHGLIVDETGEKMSKVKGNVIDPLDLVYGATFAEMVEKTLPGAPEAEALAKFKKAYPSAAAMGAGFPAFGADALRFTLATYPPSNKRIALAPKRIEGNRHFLNKIWNATRLALELLGRDFAWPETHVGADGLLQPLDPVPLRARRARLPTTGSTRSASTRRRTRPTASSGTISATGTSSWSSRSCARPPAAGRSCAPDGSPRRAPRSPTCWRAACGSSTR